MQSGHTAGHTAPANKGLFIDLPEWRVAPLRWFHYDFGGSHRNKGEPPKNQSQHRQDWKGDEPTNHQQEYLKGKMLQLKN